MNESAPHGAGAVAEPGGIQAVLHPLPVQEGDAGHLHDLREPRHPGMKARWAYKPMEAILSQIGPTVEVTERICPVYNFKAGEE